MQFKRELLWRWDSGDQALVAGIGVSDGLSFAVDAKTIADNINSASALQNLGITARASNTSTAAARGLIFRQGLDRA